MTEYDYSPQAVERFQAKMRGISDWARETSRATSPTSPTRTTSPTSYSPQYHTPPQAPQPRSNTTSSNEHRHSSSRHHHSHHRHSSPNRSRSIGEHGPRTHSRSRSNSTSTRQPPQRSRTYSYALQPNNYPAVYYPTNAVVSQRQMPVYPPGTQPQVITYDPTKSFVYNAYPGARIELQPYPQASPFPAVSHQRQPPLLKRLFTSLNWRTPSSRPSAAQQENVHVQHHSHSHSRAKSRDAGRGHDRERAHDRRRNRRNSVA